MMFLDAFAIGVIVAACLYEWYKAQLRKEFDGLSDRY